METLAATPWWVNVLLGIVAINLLIWPLTSRWVESHLELFLLGVGAAAVTISGGWSTAFLYETLNYPVNVAFIVLVVSVIFNNYSRTSASRSFFCFQESTKMISYDTCQCHIQTLCILIAHIGITLFALFVINLVLPFVFLFHKYNIKLRNCFELI